MSGWAAEVGCDWNERAAGWLPLEAPIEIEIGSGKGLFLQSVAASTPAHNFIGIEIAKKYAFLANERLERDGLSNALVLHGDALTGFRENLPDEKIAAVHVYFPDPWWKKRHKDRRVISDAMLEQIERVLAPGGIFHFWTDVLDYYELAVRQIVERTDLAGPEFVDETQAEHDLDYRTHFERRTRLNGLPVYRSQFRKHDS
jgi:tRNA (guanine-N7-)-methyltransferase